MKTPFSFTIIYNPKSTGKSPEMARDFAEELRRVFPKARVELTATKRPRHAERIAYEASVANKNCVLVSVSGDGGYHEVINGAMKAIKEKGVQPICAVLPGGNANDHHSSVVELPLIEAVKRNKPKQLDLLLAEFGRNKRYAHSYLGIGITPLVAVELNRHALSRLKETLLAAKTLVKLQPLKLEIDGEQQSLDSLVVANIPRMAKYLTMSENSDPADGKFEVIKWPHHSKRRLIRILLSSLFGNGPRAQQLARFEFQVLKKTPMQLDGEIVVLEKNTVVKVSIAPGQLQTLR